MVAQPKPKAVSELLEPDSPLLGVDIDKETGSPAAAGIERFGRRTQKRPRSSSHSGQELKRNTSGSSTHSPISALTDMGHRYVGCLLAVSWLRKCLVPPPQSAKTAETESSRRHSVLQVRRAVLLGECRLDRTGAGKRVKHGSQRQAAQNTGSVGGTSFQQTTFVDPEFTGSRLLLSRGFPCPLSRGDQIIVDDGKFGTRQRKVIAKQSSGGVEESTDVPLVLAPASDKAAQTPHTRLASDDEEKELWVSEGWLVGQLQVR